MDTALYWEIVEDMLGEDHRREDWELRHAADGHLHPQATAEDQAEWVRGLKGAANSSLESETEAARREAELIAYGHATGHCDAEGRRRSPHPSLNSRRRRPSGGSVTPPLPGDEPSPSRCSEQSTSGSVRGPPSPTLMATMPTVTTSSSVASPPHSGRRRRRVKRDQEPLETLQGAMEFSDDPELGDIFYVIGELARRPQLISDLLLDTTIHMRDGRNRLPGSWALAFLAYVMSRHVDVQPFYNAYRSTELWELCGFEQLPSRRTVHDRFAELEGHCDAFDRFRARLISIARRAEPRIGRVVTVDGSAFTSNSRIEHCCPDRDACKAVSKRPAKFAKPASEEEIREERQREKSIDETRATRRSPNALPELEPSDPLYAEAEHDPRYHYFRKDGHLYRCRDHSAGVRAYYRGGRLRKAWLGGISIAFTDAFSGAPLAELCQSADVNEASGYTAGFERLEQSLGGRPEIVAGDAAYHLKELMEFNTRRGVASVFAFRKPHPKVEREDMRTDEYDEHGIPRCRHCGAPGILEGAGLGFVITARGEPRLRFRCSSPHTAECRKRSPQSISCLKEPRLLVPLARTTLRYHQAAACVRNREHVHRHARDRGRVAGKDLSSRPRRVPIVDVQELRSAASGCLAWFRLCLRYGWLDGHRSQRRVETRPCDGQGRLRATLRARDRRGIDLPYGAAAQRAGIRTIAGSRAGPGPPGHPLDGVDDDAIPF